MPEGALRQCLTLIAFMTVRTNCALHITTKLVISISTSCARYNSFVCAVEAWMTNMALNRTFEGPHAIGTIQTCSSVARDRVSERCERASRSVRTHIVVKVLSRSAGDRVTSISSFSVFVRENSRLISHSDFGKETIVHYCRCRHLSSLSVGARN